MLQRDLAVDLAERARREQAKTVEEQKQQQPVKEAGPVALTILGDAQKRDVEMADTAAKNEGPDVTMTDVNAKAESEEQSTANPNMTDTLQKPVVDTSAEMLNNKNAPSKPTTEEHQNSTGNTGSATDTNKDLPQQYDQLDHELFDKTPTTAGMKDIDFDKLFEDDDNTNDDANNDNGNDSNNKAENSNSNSNSNPPQTTNPNASLNLSPSKPEATTTTNSTIPVSAPAPAVTTTTTTTSIGPTTSTVPAIEADVSSFLPGLESYANNVNLTDGATADIPLNLDFLDAPLGLDDMSNNENNVSSNNNAKNDINNDLAILGSLPQLPIGNNANSNPTTGDQSSGNVNNANGNSGIMANGEALNQVNLDDLFGFADGTGIDGGGSVGDGSTANVDNAFDIDGLGDFGDLLGNGSIGMDLGAGAGAGEGGGVGISGTGNDHTSNNNNINNNGNANANANANLNGTNDGDFMLSEFDDIFGAPMGS